MPESIRSPFRHGTSQLPPLIGEQIALVVVDMQYFDAHPDWGEGRTAARLGVQAAFDEYFDQLTNTVPHIQSLLSVCRDKGFEVIHLRVAELTDDSRDASWKGVVRGLAVPRQSKEANLLVEVQSVGDEIVISKSGSGAFGITNLDRILRNMEIHTLVFVGTSTGGCVESTVCDALDLGYSVIVVSDACACSTRQAHHMALERMESGFAHVLTTAEISGLLANLPPVDRTRRSGVLRAEEHVPSTASHELREGNPYHLIFGPAIELRITPEATAVVVVDAQTMACDPARGLGKLTDTSSQPSRAYYDRVKQAIPNIQKLLGAAREANVLVTFVRTVAQTTDGRDLSPTVRALGVVPLLGSRDAEILPDLAPQLGEPVLNKLGAGILAGSGLDEMLRNVGINVVILVGVSYNGAIEASIRSLTDRGYGVLVVPDGCATFDETLQRHLWDAATGIINVASTADVVERIRGLHPVQVTGALKE